MVSEGALHATRWVGNGWDGIGPDKAAYKTGRILIVWTKEGLGSQQQAYGYWDGV